MRRSCRGRCSTVCVQVSVKHGHSSRSHFSQRSWRSCQNRWIYDRRTVPLASDPSVEQWSQTHCKAVKSHLARSSHSHGLRNKGGHIKYWLWSLLELCKLCFCLHVTFCFFCKWSLKWNCVMLWSHFPSQHHTIGYQKEDGVKKLYSSSAYGRVHSLQQHLKPHFRVWEQTFWGKCERL